MPSGTTGAAMSDMHYPEWQKAYWEASLQVNPEKLAVRIFGAETAILKRRHALQRSSDGHKEREAIEGALSLRVLQRKRLDYPPGSNRIVDVPLSVFLGAVPLRAYQAV